VDVSARRPAWLIWLVSGACAAAVHPLLDSARAAALAGVLGVGSCVLTVTGVRRHRPADAPAWLLLTLGQVLWVAGDVAYAAAGLIGHHHDHPSVADALYLSAYPVLTAGLFRLSRDRRPRRYAALIDTAIIVVSLAIVYWVFVIGPIATDAARPLPGRLVTIGYPTAGILLFAVVVQLAVRNGRRTPSRWLLTAGSALTLVHTVPPAYPAIVSTGHLLAYVCWTAAALHPGRRSLAAGPAGDQLGRYRVGLLAGAMLLVPAVLLVQRGNGLADFSWLVVALGSAALILLVCVRLSGFVTEVRDQAARLGELAMCDDLTGLPNRRRFEQCLRAALTAGSPQVAVVDLADFKSINERFGRCAADRALVAVAERLSATVEDPVMVARMGGDEFAVLLPDATPAEGAAVCGRLTAALRRPVHSDEHELLFNACVGIAGADGTADAGELLRRADTALDAAKTQGYRYCRYRPELDERAEEVARLGAELRHALDEGQFRMVYQPIAELPGGRIAGVEALVRWQHPTRGVVGPTEFIPVAERNGLIVELGAWILRAACAQGVAWRAEFGVDAPGYLSVNVSARQLAQPDFPGFVASVLRSTGLPAAALLVEVTETAVFGGGTAVRAVAELRSMGVRVALDDFGTGHSSLGLLQTVPVDVLKVDKSFVDTITMAGRHAVIAQALIDVSDGLGLVAVAEGVQTAEQAAELYRLGYRLAQGYHFGEPAAQPEFRRGTRQIAA
jgi:diguanylate cyclase (GGDEF)-like protein